MKNFNSIYNLPLVGSALYYFRVYRKILKKKIFYFLAIMFFVAGLESLGIASLLPLFEFLSNPNGTFTGTTKYFVLILHSFGVVPSVKSFSVVVVAIFMLKGAFLYVAYLYRSHILTFLSSNARFELIDAIKTVDYQWLLSKNDAYLTNLMTSEMVRYTGAFLVYTNSIMKAISALTLCFSLLAIDSGLFLIVLFSSPVVASLMRSFVKIAKKKSREMSVENELLTLWSLHSTSSTRYLKSVSKFDVIFNILKNKILKIKHLEFKLMSINSIVLSLTQPLMVVYLLSILYLNYTFFSGSLFETSISIMYLYRLVSEMMAFQGDWQTFNNYVGSIEVVNQGIDQMRSNSRVTKSSISIDHIKSLTVRNMSVSFSGSAIIRDVSLNLVPNTIYALVGESGAGKSTIINSLTRLLSLQSGEILINGVNILDVNWDSLEGKIGYVTQNSVVFDASIKDNITLFSEKVDEGMLEYSIDKSGLRTLIQSFSKGVDSVVGSSGIQLSGGQKQRISFAREIYKNVDILLLDEPTSALDSETEHILNQSIVEYSKNRIILIVAHRESTIRIADYVYVLNRGEIIEEGYSSNLLSQKESYLSKILGNSR